MKIICFGDSNTWGYDPRGYFGGRYDHPWPQVLSRKLDCTVINQGENGRQIPRGPVVFPSDADLVIVMLGTNDLLQGLSPEEACGRMECFIKTLDPERLFLIAPPPMKPGTWVSDQKLIADSESLIQHLRRLAGTFGIRFAEAGQWHVILSHDGVHLSEDGHRAFAEGLSKELNDM